VSNLTHHAVHTDVEPEAGATITGYMPAADVGDVVTIIPTSGGLAYGEVVEKNLPDYVAPVQVVDHTEPRDLGVGYVRIQVDE